MAKKENWQGPGRSFDKPQLSIIKELADKRGWNITKLSDESGVSHQTIYNYLNGASRPYAINLYFIAKSLDTTVENILKKSGIKYNKNN